MEYSGEYINEDFSDWPLEEARLSGIFIEIDFSDRCFKGAQLTGLFVRCNFSGAKFCDASLAGGRFNQVNFCQATVTDQQLAEAFPPIKSTGPDCTPLLNIGVL